MKRIENINDLKKEDRIVCFNGLEYIIYKFLMIHPHNNSYILCIEPFGENATKFYIPDIINGNNWFIFEGLDDIHREIIRRCRDEIKYDRNSIKTPAKSLNTENNNIISFIMNELACSTKGKYKEGTEDYEKYVEATKWLENMMDI